MSSHGLHPGEDDRFDLSWMLDTDEVVCFLAPLSHQVQVDETTEEGADDVPASHALVQVRNGVAQVTGEPGVQIAVVDWDEIDSGCVETLYQAYEQVSALSSDAPERDETLEELEDRLTYRPKEEVEGLWAIVDAAGSSDGPGLLVTVRRGTSLEYCHKVEAHWVDWDTIEGDDNSLSMAYSEIESLPEDFPSRDELLRECDTLLGQTSGTSQT